MTRHVPAARRSAVPLVAAGAAALLLAPPGSAPGDAEDPAAGGGALDRHGPPPAAAAPAPVQERTPLRETGNAAFAAVREVVAELESRPDTDWSRVDLERLRRHLADMRHFTLHAEVVDRRPVEGGLVTTVRGTTPEADRAIRGAVRAHAPFLREETGWEARAEETPEGVVLEVVARDEADARKIRGLGYIGLMAEGSHHREHHWAIATGRMPHGHGARDAHGHGAGGAPGH